MICVPLEGPLGWLPWACLCTHREGLEVVPGNLPVWLHEHKVVCVHADVVVQGLIAEPEVRSAVAVPREQGRLGAVSKAAGLGTGTANTFWMTLHLLPPCLCPPLSPPTLRPLAPAHTAPAVPPLSGEQPPGPLPQGILTSPAGYINRLLCPLQAGTA